MRYKVTREYDKGSKTQFAQFADLNDAKFFIQAKLADDALLKVKVTYCIEEFNEVIMEFAPTSGSQSQGKSSELNFRPSPLSTGLRPPGMQQNWKPGDDEKDKKK